MTLMTNLKKEVKTLCNNFSKPAFYDEKVQAMITLRAYLKIFRIWRLDIQTYEVTKKEEKKVLDFLIQEIEEVLK